MHDDLIDRALAEDVGDGDVTTAATVPPGARGTATIVLKQPGVLSGLPVARAVFERLDPDCAVEVGETGVWLEPGAVALRVSGSAAALLTGERTALNFLQRLSGVATVTASVVRAVAAAGGGATILDTRKTTPGLRALEKRAVADGGGTNHRTGLFDAILIKENHAAMAGGVGLAVEAARRAKPDLQVEVEVRSVEELDEALAARADIVLLDNMTPAEIADAVRRVDGRAKTEASGGIGPETVVAYATVPGLDYVSLGWLTHSAPALDLSLLLGV